MGVKGRGGDRGVRECSKGAPAEVAAREREGRATPKREGEEDEKKVRRDGPMGGEGKNCLGKRREEAVGGPITFALQFCMKGQEKIGGAEEGE